MGEMKAEEDEGAGQEEGMGRGREREEKRGIEGKGRETRKGGAKGR
jgi:hypothetical protein